MSSQLEGRIALVTGAASPRGLGRAMTAALVGAGARVSMLDVREDWLDDAAAAMRAIGGADSVMTQVVNVGSAGQAARAVEATVAQWGALHILVNNAGITRSNMLSAGATNNVWDIPVEEWDRVFSVNADGPFYMIRAAMPHLLEAGWGRIIWHYYQHGHHVPGRRRTLRTLEVCARVPRGHGVAGASRYGRHRQRTGAGRDDQHRPDPR